MGKAKSRNTHALGFTGAAVTGAVPGDGACGDGAHGSCMSPIRASVRAGTGAGADGAVQSGCSGAELARRAQRRMRRGADAEGSVPRRHAARDKACVHRGDVRMADLLYVLSWGFPPCGVAGPLRCHDHRRSAHVRWGRGREAHRVC